MNILNSLNKSIKSFLYKYIPCPYEPTFSQSGEDKIIQWLIHEKKVAQFNYLDIGTNHPIQANNTYKFYKQGSRGVCVEADPGLIKKIRKYREFDIILNTAVSTNNAKSIRFYIFEQSGYSTAVEEEALKRQKAGCPISKTVDVPSQSINDIIKNNFDSYPVLLSLDIEGLDLAVLKDIDFGYYPIPIICVETCVFSLSHVRPKDLSIAKFLLEKNYFSYADTYINTIFVNKDWFFK